MLAADFDSDDEVKLELGVIELVLVEFSSWSVWGKSISFDSVDEVFWVFCVLWSSLLAVSCVLCSSLIAVSCELWSSLLAVSASVNSELDDSFLDK